MKKMLPPSENESLNGVGGGGWGAGARYNEKREKVSTSPHADTWS